MDIFWRKEGRSEKGNGRKKKRRGNSDNARFHISPEKMNEPSHSLTLLLLLELLLATHLKMGTVVSGYFDFVKIIASVNFIAAECIN